MSMESLEISKILSGIAVFNINSLWMDLLSLKNVLDANGGILPLALIRNQKTLDPRDPKAPKFFRLKLQWVQQLNVLKALSF